MREFARLYAALDETTATGEKVAALVGVFPLGAPGRCGLGGPLPDRTPPEAPGVVGEARRLGRRSRRNSALAVRRELRRGRRPGGDHHAAAARHRRVERSAPRPLGRGAPAAAAGSGRGRSSAARCWRRGRELDRRERFVWNKLITGAFRVGASSRLVERALAAASGVPEGAIAHRLMGGWEPTAEFFARLLAADVQDADVSRPYPFYLAYPLEAQVESLGPRPDWQAEWKWDGIRSQLIRRRTDLPLVPRRGAAERAISGGGGGRRAAAGRHGDRRRAAALERRSAAAVRADAAAHRPEGGEPQDPRRGAGGADRLRPAGGAG